MKYLYFANITYSESTQKHKTWKSTLGHLKENKFFFEKKDKIMLIELYTIFYPIPSLSLKKKGKLRFSRTPAHRS